MGAWDAVSIARVIDLLTSIDVQLRNQKSAAAPSQDAHTTRTATPAELDKQYGDPQVRWMPRFWTGDNYKGKKYSDCPAELLDLIAESMDWAAEQALKKNEQTPDGKAIAPFRRRDAAKARGWAARKRAGWKPAEVVDDTPDWAKGETEPLGDMDANEINW